MRAADGVEMRVPAEERPRRSEEYAPLADPEGLKAKQRQFASRHGHRQIEAWCQEVDAGAWEILVASLLTVHYDPAYATSARRSYPHVSRVVSLSDATPAALDELARSLHPGVQAPSLSS